MKFSTVQRLTFSDRPSFDDEPTALRFTSWNKHKIVPPGTSGFANGPKKMIAPNLQMDPKGPRVVDTGHSVLVAADAFAQEP